MKQLNMFSTKTLNEVLQVLSFFPGKMTEEVRVQIEKHIVSTQPLLPASLPLPHVASCPSCHVPLIGPYVVDGLRIMRCGKKCGYSEVV